MSYIEKLIKADIASIENRVRHAFNQGYDLGFKDGKERAKALEQEPSRDIEEIKEVINCNADAETKCKMISNILTAKPHYFEEPFINKSCVSSGVCEHDKQKDLDKIRAEIKKWYWQADKQALAKDPCVVDAMIDLFIRTIDKYKAEK